MNNAIVAFLVGIILMAAGAAIGHKYDQRKYDALNAEYNQFKGGVEAAGRAQLAETRRLDAAAAQRSKRAEADHSKRAATDRDTIARLRNELDSARDTRGGFVPYAPAGSVCPDGLACYDRAELGRALRGLTEEVRGLADESAAVERALNAAKGWAQQ